VAAQVLPGGLALGLRVADPRLRPIPAMGTSDGAILPPGAQCTCFVTVLKGNFTNAQKKRNRVQHLQFRILKVFKTSSNEVHMVSM